MMKGRKCTSGLRTSAAVIAVVLVATGCIQRGARFEIKKGTLLAHTMRQAPTGKLGDYESTREYEVADFLPSELISGEGFVVEDTAMILGPLFLYRVNSDEGEYTALGRAMLRRRIDEIRALPLLRELGDYDSYTSAAVDSALDPVDGAKSLVTHPIDTAGRMAQGGKIAVKSTWVSYLTGKSETEDSYFSSLVSVSKYKRKAAAETGVDVYTDNEKVQDELDRVGYAGSSGAWTPSILTLPIGGPFLQAVSTVGYVNNVDEYIEELSPGTLRQLANDELEALGVSADTRYTFLAHPNLSPRMILLITRSAGELEGVQNLDPLLMLACQVRSLEEGLFFQQLIEMLAHYHQQSEPLTGIGFVHDFPVGVTESGGLTVALPVDFVRWTYFSDSVSEQLLAMRDSNDPGAAINVYCTGKFSPRAISRLEERGIAVYDDLDESLKLEY